MARTQSLLSFLVLAAVSGYCFYDYYNSKGMEYEFPYLTYFFPTAHGIIGSMIHLLNTSNNRLWRWLFNTEVFVKTISFPCFVTEIWLKYGVIQPEAAWIHAIVGAIPAAIFVLDDRLKRNWIDIIVYLSTLSLVAVCIQNPNYWGLASGTAFLAGYYILRENKHPLRIRPDICFNLLTATFAGTSLIALTS